MKLKKWLASGLAAILLASGATLAVSSSASAHNARVTGVAVCLPDGTRTVTWTGETSNVPAGETATATVKSYTPPTSNIATTTASVAPNGGFTFTQTGIPGTANNANINVDVLWTNGYKVSDQTGHVQFGFDCAQPDVLDASAAVTVTQATCTTPGSAVLGILNFANLVGALDTTPGAHTATFQAVAGHKFVGNLASITVNYTVPDKDLALCPTNVVCDAYTNGGTSTDLNANGWVPFDTRSKGHADYVAGGLHVYSDPAAPGDSPDQRKLQWIKDVTDAPLSQVGQFAADYDNTSGTAPGVKINVTFAPGLTGTLIWEEVYDANPGDQDVWLPDSANAAIIAPDSGGGFGSTRHGTINEWLTVYPGATFTAKQFGNGSGVDFDGVLHSVTVGCVTDYFDKVPLIDTPEPRVEFERTEYVGQGWVCDATTETLSRTEVTVRTFFKVVVVGDHYEVQVDRVERSEPLLQTIIRQLDESEIFDCPTVVTTGEVSKIDECGIANDKVVLPETEGVTYTVVWSEDGQSQATVTATADEGYVLEEGAQTEWVLDFTNEACPVVTKVPGTPLAATGVDDILWLTGALAVLLLLAGAAVVIVNKRRDRSAA